MLTRKLLAAALLALAGCATTADYTTVRREQFRNDEGKVVGHRELLRNKATGELVHKVELYDTLLDSEGKVIGYEQRTKTGAVAYDADGRPIGTRIVDLRSRGTNPASRGVVFMY
jgi:YD repeat-containing protein